MKKSNRQIVLEELLNSEVTKLHESLFKWHGRLYEVIAYKESLQRQNANLFIKREYKGFHYMIRQASREVIKKYYTNYAEELSKDGSK